MYSVNQIDNLGDNSQIKTKYPQIIIARAIQTAINNLVCNPLAIVQVIKARKPRLHLYGGLPQTTPVHAKRLRWWRDAVFSWKLLRLMAAVRMSGRKARFVASNGDLQSKFQKLWFAYGSIRDGLPARDWNCECVADMSKKVYSIKQHGHGESFQRERMWAKFN